MFPFNRSQLKKQLTPAIIKMIQLENKPVDLYKNTLDCFSAVIDSMTQGITLEEWVKQEQSRKKQKSKQNIIGDLHQIILATLEGVTDLETGKIVDILCEEKKIIAEIKNKHNTTKGNHKKEIYDDLEKVLEEYEGYTAYYVEILPASPKRYNECFTPPDNHTKTKRPENACIRRVDGASFYTLLTDQEDAMQTLYQLLPDVIFEILTEAKLLNEQQLEHIKDIKQSDFFETFFNKVIG